MRHVLITKRRSEKLEWANKLVLGDQAGDHFLSFNTSFSWHVYATYDEVEAIVKKEKDFAKKLDILFG